MTKIPWPHWPLGSFGLCPTVSGLSQSKPLPSRAAAAAAQEAATARPTAAVAGLAGHPPRSRFVLGAACLRGNRHGRDGSPRRFRSRARRRAAGGAPAAAARLPRVPQRERPGPSGVLHGSHHPALHKVRRLGRSAQRATAALATSLLHCTCACGWLQTYLFVCLLSRIMPACLFAAASG